MTTVGDLATDAGAVNGPEKLAVDPSAGDGHTDGGERGPVSAEDTVEDVTLRTGTGQPQVRVLARIKPHGLGSAAAEFAGGVAAELVDRVADQLAAGTGAPLEAPVPSAESRAGYRRSVAISKGLTDDRERTSLLNIARPEAERC
jgi:hypothetical protein